MDNILLKHLENHEIIKIKSDKFKLFELFYYRKNGMILKVMNKEFKYTEKTSKFIFFQGWKIIFYFIYKKLRVNLVFSV